MSLNDAMLAMDKALVRWNLSAARHQFHKCLQCSCSDVVKLFDLPFQSYGINLLSEKSFFVLILNF